MIILLNKFWKNKFSKKGRPFWQEKYDQRDRLLMFTGPLFWTYEDLATIGPIPPELIEHWWSNPLYKPIAKAVSSFPYGTIAASGGGTAGPTVALSSITTSDIGFGTREGGFRYETGGSLSVDPNYGSAYTDRTNEWVASGDKSAGIGSDYEAYADETTETGGTHTGGWTDSTTYYTISSDLQLAVGPIYDGIVKSIGNTAIRQKTYPANNASTTFNMTADSWPI